MNVIEELTETEAAIDRHYVERRLDDWRRRLNRLYDDIEGWLPLDWSMIDGESVPIHEELMERLSVPERRLPAKLLLRRGTGVGRLEPRGLWIIGTNGRVDLILPDAHYVIVDRADSFEPSNWQVASLDARRNQRRLTGEVVVELLR